MFTVYPAFLLDGLLSSIILVISSPRVHWKRIVDCVAERGQGQEQGQRQEVGERERESERGREKGGVEVRKREERKGGEMGDGTIGIK